MKQKGKTGRKPMRQRTTHMVRLGERAYTRLMEVYAMFLKKVSMSPELYSAYADRQVTISEVVCIVTEAFACQLIESSQA